MRVIVDRTLCESRGGPRSRDNAGPVRPLRACLGLHSVPNDKIIGGGAATSTRSP